VAETNTDVATPYGAKALKRVCDAIVNATSHQDDTRNRECYGIGQLVGGGELPEAEALSALQDAAAKMPDLDPARPWDRRLLAKRAADSFMQGKAKPRAAASAVEPMAFKTSFDLRHTEPPLKFPFRETRIAGDTYAVEIRSSCNAASEYGTHGLSQCVRGRASKLGANDPNRSRDRRDADRASRSCGLGYRLILRPLPSPGVRCS
jgi:hypothetical protein